MKKNLGGGVNDFRHSTLLILGTHLRKLGIRLFWRKSCGVSLLRSYEAGMKSDTLEL